MLERSLSKIRTAAKCVLQGNILLLALLIAHHALKEPLRHLMEQRYALLARPAKRPTLTRLLANPALLVNTLLFLALHAYNVLPEHPTPRKGKRHVVCVNQAMPKQDLELVNVNNV